MHVKASFTVENSVLIPIFVILFMGMVALAGYYHDKIIIKGVVEETALEMERWPEERIVEEEAPVVKRLREYISRKTLFMREIEVEIERSNQICQVVCRSRYAFSVVKQITGTRETQAESRDDCPSSIIRTTEAIMEGMNL